jgi:hypothetical protein
VLDVRCLVKKSGASVALATPGAFTSRYLPLRIRGALVALATLHAETNMSIYVAFCSKRKSTAPLQIPPPARAPSPSLSLPPWHLAPMANPKRSRKPGAKMRALKLRQASLALGCVH